MTLAAFDWVRQQQGETWYRTFLHILSVEFSIRHFLVVVEAKDRGLSKKQKDETLGSSYVETHVLFVYVWSCNYLLRRLLARIGIG